MSKKKINLDQIFDNNFDCYTELNTMLARIKEPAISKDSFKKLCLQYSIQLLELASENAEWNVNDDADMHNVNISIDEQSILDTIKQIEL